MSVDRWTSAGNKNFIGVYISFRHTKYFMGLIHYIGVCGATKIRSHLESWLETFGFLLSDVSFTIIDCGSDVQKFASDVDLLNFQEWEKIFDYLSNRVLFFLPTFS